MQTVKQEAIALYGLGTVGTGFVELLKQHPDAQRFNLKYIIVKDQGKSWPYGIEPHKGHPLDPLSDPEITTIIELTNDSAFSKSLAMKALKKGKHFITANKKMLAGHINGLERLARSEGVALRYEGAAAASIPIFLLSEQYYTNDRISGLRAVLNGTSNYILSAMEQGGTGFAEALKKAQEAGFAETDPSLDVKGLDAAYKLTLLSRKLLKRKLSPEQLNIQGVAEVRKTHAALASQLGWRIRHVCELRDEGGTQRSFVGPAFVSSSDPLFHLQEADNGIQIQSNTAGTQFLQGKGAGKYPTGYAVLSDLTRPFSDLTPHVEVADYPVLELPALYCHIGEDHISEIPKTQVVLEGEWQHLWVKVVKFQSHPGAGWIRIESELLPELAGVLWHKQVYA